MLTSLAMALASLPAEAPSVLAEAGKTDWVVWVSGDATEAERHAAGELARFLREISGADFPLRAAAEPPAAATRAILVGPGAAAALVSAGEVAKLGEEGYVLRSRGPHFAIAGGRPRGTLYGVYSFLEDELGCRWFTADCARIPKRERIALRPLERTFIPKLEYRATDYPGSRDADWAARNKMNGTQAHLDERRGGKVAYGPFVHTFNSILDPRQHFDAHPEYFSEVNGKRLRERTQLCVTNPDVLRIAVETVKRWMRESPGAAIFSVSQNDWENYCTCARCAAMAAEEGSPMGPYLRFVNAVAGAVSDEFPGKAVDTLAYQFTRKPPRQTSPRPDVIVRLCSIECCFSHPLASSPVVDPANAAFAADLREWGRKSSRLYIWDYVIDYSHSLLPFPNLWSLKPNINFFIENGVKGIYEEANYFSKGGELAELRTWIIAKTLWDPAYDTERAIDEFLAGYYEEAAPSLRRYIDLIHEKARSGGVHFHIGTGPESPLFTGELLAGAAEIFAEAERAAAAKPHVIQRLRTARLPVLYVEIARLLARIKEAKAPAGEERARLKALHEEFDAAVRAEGITHVSEGRSYESWSAEVKQSSSATGSISFRAEDDAPSRPDRPAPPGEHCRRADPALLGATAFRKDQPVVGTYYFYWYDAGTGEHFVDPDKSDALTDHPLEKEGYSYRSPAWHRREILDMLAAGLDFMLPVFWGYPDDYRGWSFAGLPPLVEACRGLEKDGKRPPRIGLFYDTSTLQWNSRRFHADLSTAAGKEWLYVTARDFYSMIPPDLRATVEGRPLVWFYSAGFAKKQDPAALDYLREEFEKDFGVGPFIVKEVSWQGRADAIFAWGAALKPNFIEVAAVGPGYDHSAVPGRKPLVREREDGAFYSRAWETALSFDPERRPRLAIVETWNEFHEGTEIAPTKEHGRKYVELTRKYADLWRAGKRLARPGPYARARQVSLVLGKTNEERGLAQREHDDGKTEPCRVAGKEGRRTVAAARGGGYIYFDADDSFFVLQDALPLEVEFTYLDQGKGAISFEYDSSDASAPLAGAFKAAAPVALKGSGAWRTVVVRLSDAAFTGRANGHDFRLSVPGGDLTLHRVEVRKSGK